MCDLSKTELRIKYKNIRNSISAKKRDDKSKNILMFFKAHFSFANNYFIYLSFGSEAKTGDIIKYLQETDKRLAIPKCNTENLTMQAVSYHADDFLCENSYGILENNISNYFDEKIDVILLPLLTADRFGNRIGFGKGYYDKFINSLNYKPILVGLCYNEQIYDGVLPHDEYDAKLDFIITDAEIIKICE